MYLFPGLLKARLLRCHIVVMFMTLWKISLVECVQHVHMLELRNWRSFQEELPSFVLLCSSTMSFPRILSLFRAVLNWVLLTMTITITLGGGEATTGNTSALRRLYNPLPKKITLRNLNFTLNLLYCKEHVVQAVCAGIDDWGYSVLHVDQSWGRKSLAGISIIFVNWLIVQQ